MYKTIFARGILLSLSLLARGDTIEWRQDVPPDCPFEMSEDFAGVRFTGAHSNYQVGDTFYPSWAGDGNLYSPWTDGVTNGVKCTSGGGIKTGHKTGHAVMIGDDPELKALCEKAFAEAEGATFKHGNLSWISADQIYLARVTPSPETINDLDAYEFFAGHDGAGNPIWTGDFDEIKPLVEWNNHMGCVTATWVPALQKYLMCVTDGWPTVTKMTSYILEADQLTGPWKMVAYMKDFGEQAYFLNIPSKFISDDGRSMWLCYSANFANEKNGLLVEPMKIYPPGGRYGLSLHEMELIPRSE